MEPERSKILFLVIIFFIAGVAVTAQQKTFCPPSSVKKANKYFDDAAEARKKHKDYADVKEQDKN